MPGPRSIPAIPCATPVGRLSAQLRRSAQEAAVGDGLPKGSCPTLCYCSRSVPNGSAAPTADAELCGDTGLTAVVRARATLPPRHLSFTNRPSLGFRRMTSTAVPGRGLLRPQNVDSGSSRWLVCGRTPTRHAQMLSGPAPFGARRRDCQNVAVDKRAITISHSTVPSCWSGS
jgi:hypothetical protein